MYKSLAPSPALGGVANKTGPRAHISMFDTMEPTCEKCMQQMTCQSRARVILKRPLAVQLLQLALQHSVASWMCTPVPGVHDELHSFLRGGVLGGRIQGGGDPAYRARLCVADGGFPAQSGRLGGGAKGSGENVKRGRAGQGAGEAVHHLLLLRARGARGETYSLFFSLLFWFRWCSNMNFHAGAVGGHVLVGCCKEAWLRVRSPSAKSKAVLATYNIAWECVHFQ